MSREFDKKNKIYIIEEIEKYINSIITAPEDTVGEKI